VDNSGNIFVTGSSVGTNVYREYATLAYSGAGTALWTSRHKGTGNGGDRATAIAVDSSGNVFVTGASAGTNGSLDSYDCVTIKYSAIVPPIHLAIVPDGSGGYSIRVQGTAGVTYALQRTQSLTGPWSTCAPQTAPASGLLEFHDLFPPSDRAFYRAVQQ